MKKDALNLSKYDTLIVFIIACVLITIVCVWMWFGHKDAEIENEILKLKYTVK